MVNAHVPPFQYDVTGLRAMTKYNMSVYCTNEVGKSQPSAWVKTETPEGGEELSPHFLLPLKQLPMQSALQHTVMNEL